MQSARLAATALVLCAVAGCRRGVLPASQATHSATTRTSGPVTRSVYPYSVVPGGVETRAELESALSRDPVAAEHFRGVNLRSLAPATLPADTLAYVSYRRNGRVFWTANKVHLRAGEPVLSDGVSACVRGRCGNRIAFVPQRPVAATRAEEPASEDLMTPVPAAGLPYHAAVLPIAGAKVPPAPPAATGRAARVKAPAEVVPPPVAAPELFPGFGGSGGPGTAPVPPPFLVVGPGGGVTPPLIPIAPPEIIVAGERPPVPGIGPGSIVSPGLRNPEIVLITAPGGVVWNGVTPANPPPGVTENPGGTQPPTNPPQPPTVMPPGGVTTPPVVPPPGGGKPPDIPPPPPVTPPPVTPPPVTPPPVATPEPGTWAIAGAGLVIFAWRRCRCAAHN